MKVKLIALGIKLVASYLRKHPELLKKVTDRIPGQIDDFVIERLLGL